MFLELMALGVPEKLHLIDLADSEHRSKEAEEQG